MLVTVLLITITIEGMAITKNSINPTANQNPNYYTDIAGQVYDLKDTMNA